MKGSIEKRGENSYRLVVSTGVDGTGKQVKLTRLFKTDDGMTDADKRKEAETALAEFITDIRKGNTAQSKGMTVSGLWVYWQENYAVHNLEDTSLFYYRQLWPRIEKALGNSRLDRIQPRHVQSFMKNLAEPGIKKASRKKNKPAGETKIAPASSLSPATMRKYHALLQSIFTKAVQWRLMDYNPCAHTSPPRAAQKEKAIYDVETTGKFLSEMEGEETAFRLMVMLAFTAGLRREEIFGLRWTDIDEANLSIRQARVCIGKQVVTKQPKTSSSRRSVSVPAEVATLIKRHSAQEAAKKLQAGKSWQGSDLVFTNKDGSALHPQTMNNFLKQFCKIKGLPQISPHAFRHMNATFLIASGTDYRTVSGKLGHRNTTITMNLYSHLLKSAEQETANTMTGIIATAKQQAKDAEEKQKAQAK